ncbi:MAG: ArsR family transcriptional regulator [Frankiales bacterium]|nr:ArsR family transcriptional regulator [Frankiales bacterium]
MRALASPVRLQVLSLLTGTPMSAAELARELDVAHAAASYHLRRLADAGLVELAEERVHRGGRERRYRACPRPLTAAPGDRVLLAEALAGQLRRRTADHDDALPETTADAELWVDPELYADVVVRVRAALQDLHDAARPPRTEGTRRVAATVALFGMRT